MFNNIGPGGLLLIAVVVLVLFGRGKIAGMMGEVGKGITSFRRGMKEGADEIENASRTAAAEAARDITPEKDRV
jgi:sec-independent protein translocase protein TatA